MFAATLMSWSCLLPSLQSPAPGHTQEPSFLTRVETFWREWTRDSKRLHDSIARPDNAEATVAEMRERLDAMLPGVAWSFAAGDAPDTHKFILSSEGDLYQWLLIDYWAKHAPKLEGWEFHGSTPPHAGADFELNVHGRSFAPEEYRFVLQPDEENEVVHVVVWHDGFNGLDEEQRAQVSFLALDHVLGEDLVEMWIGKVQGAHKAIPTPTCGLKDLRQTLRKALQDRKWNPDLRRDERFMLYKGTATNPPTYPREDLAIGTSIHPWLAIDYIEAGGALQDPLAGTGACYAWIAIPTECFDRATLVDRRSAIADAIEKELDAGRVLGGAFGEHEVCIDLLLFDHARALPVIERVLGRSDRVRSARLHFFAKGREPIAVRTKQDSDRK